MSDTQQETTGDEAHEPAWWEWAEEHWEEIVDYIKSVMNPNKPNPPVVPTPPPTPAPPLPLPPTSGQIGWVSQDPEVTDADLVTLCDGLNAGFPGFQKLWPHVEQWVNTPVPAGSTPPAGALSAVVRLSQSDDPPGALAWHDVDQNNRPFIIVLSDTCRAAGVSLSSVADHEFKELSVDPSCTATADAPPSSPYPGVWALEVADPVEADARNVTTPGGATVELSDEVGMSFFDVGTSALDETDSVTKPFTLAPGGYAIVNGQDVFADKKEGHEQRPPIGPVPARKREAAARRADEILAALAAGFPEWDEDADA